MADFLSTGIETLDTLLGGEGIPTGSCVLVRGEPGTGKTTLAFQIARHNLVRLKDESFSVLWLAAEETPAEEVFGPEEADSAWLENEADQHEYFLT